MSKPPVTHLRDIRSYNNGGVAVPVCDTSSDKLFHFGEVVNGKQVATCKRCPGAYAKRYPWAVRR